MTRRSRFYETPAHWVAADGTWPDGPFVAESPAPVAYARHLSLELGRALAGKNKAAVCRDAEIERSTLYDLLNGRNWADAITMVKLEAALGIRAWPPTPPDLPLETPGDTPPT